MCEDNIIAESVNVIVQNTEKSGSYESKNNLENNFRNTLLI
jgi:hypothetical protein